ncbi:MAG TPA: DUF2252 domain-containing protein [Solirubrobacterales bacterium]|nr:DUF2252 domain-containing protein [Solirubrobacterales bacterium]
MTTRDAPAGEKAVDGFEAGRAARKSVPRSSQGVWEAPGDREDPLAILAAQDETRVEELVPVRYGRMLASPFTFYRGAAAIMGNDLGGMPHSGIEVQLCGDAHLSNFGVFQAPDRKLVFDINDFDETLPGPFEWDVKRMVASFEIGGRDREFDTPERRACTLTAARAYREAIRGFAEAGELDVWYARLPVEEIGNLVQSKVTKEDRRRFEKALEKARNKDSIRALSKLTEEREGELRIASRPPVLVPVREIAGGADESQIEEVMRRLLSRYRETLDGPERRLAGRFTYIDAAHKVVGVGSVGTRAWIALLRGEKSGEPLFLQVKEASSSVLEPFAGKSRYKHHGKRVVMGQRLMQAAGDIFLGWLDAIGLDGVERCFYVRQLWDGKGSAEIESMSPDVMKGYAQLCGWTLARAHARSGDRQAISGYLGGNDRFERAMVEFAESYADQNEADYATLIAAEKAGKLTVLRGV